MFSLQRSGAYKEELSKAEDKGSNIERRSSRRKCEANRECKARGAIGQGTLGIRVEMRTIRCRGKFLC